MKLLWILLLVPAFLFAEDIYLKNGQIYKNVKIISETATYLLVEINGKTTGMTKEAIDRIDKTIFNENEESKITGEIISSGPKNGPQITTVLDASKNSEILNSSFVIKRKMANAPLLGLSLASFYLAYDYLQVASETKDDKIKSRVTIGGILFAVVGLINTMYALTPVDVVVKADQVNVSYQYNLK